MLYIGYGPWIKSTPCSVTCGNGVEIWTRKCNNLAGKYDSNCSKLGPTEEIRICEMEACPGRITELNIQKTWRNLEAF